MLGRPTEARIDLAALKQNLETSKSFVGDDQRILAVVKADAYGHGAVEVARTLEAAEVDWFGVALVEEGVALRKGGVLTPILCLGSFYPGQESTLLENNLTPILYDIDIVAGLHSYLEKNDRSIDVHLKFDTGMGRVGVPYEQADRFLAELIEFRRIRVTGLMTHYSDADSLNCEYTEMQTIRFEEILKMASRHGIQDFENHLANTPGALGFEKSRTGLVRLGGALYGLVDDMIARPEEFPGYRQVMEVVSKVAFLKTVSTGEDLGYGRTFTTERESRIATVPVGYADGYPRSLSNSADVLINGQRAPICGRVSMDWILVDVSEVEGVAVGDDVCLIGSQGNERISASELAGKAGTISYEITCGFGARVPRNYDQTE